MAPTTKSEYMSRTMAALNQQAVAALVDQLADFAVENDRLKAENALLNQQISGIRKPQDTPIPT